MARRSKRIPATTHKFIKARSDCAVPMEAANEHFARPQASMIDETLIIRNEKIPDPAPPGAPFTADVIGNILDHSDRQASAHEDEAVSIEAIRKRAAAILGNGNSSTQRKSKRQREQGKRWLRMFEELLLFKVVNGHTKVPNYYPQCQELGSWVACLWRQHRELQEGKISNLTREKMDVLGLVGFWGISRSSFNSDVRGGNVNVSSEPHICQGWNLEFEGLKEYKRKFDDTLVPKNHDSSMRCPVKRTTNLNTTDKLNKRLNMEISNAEKSEESREKSTSYVSGEVDTGLQKLRKSKRQKKKEEKWLEMFHRLKLYKELTGHCDVPQWCPGNQELGSFVASQRDHYRYFQEGKSFSLMTDEKLSILTSIGFIWEPLLNAQVTCRKGTLVDDDSGESNEVTQPLLSPVDDSYVPTSPARVDKDLVEKYSIALATASRKGQSSIQHALFSQQPRILAEEVNVKSDMVLSIRNSGALLQQDFLCEKSSLQAPMKESSPDEKVDFEDSDKCATLAKNTKDLDSERPIVAKWKLKKGDTTNFPNCYLPLYKGVTVRPSGKWQAQIYYSGKSRYVGVFDDQKDAGRVYERVHRQLKSGGGRKVTPVEADGFYKATLKAALEWHRSTSKNIHGEKQYSKCSRVSHKQAKSAINDHQSSSICKKPRKKRKTLMDT